MFQLLYLLHIKQKSANLTWHEHIEGGIAIGDPNLGRIRLSVEAHVVGFGIVCLVALAKASTPSVA